MADEIRPTPRNPLFGLFSDFVNVPLDYMSDPRRTQQMQGIASFIRGTGVPSTLENLSYDPSGRGLFTGAGGLGGTTRMRPEAIEAALTLAPGVGPAARLAGRGAVATGRTLGPTAAGMTERYMQRQGMMPSLDVYQGTPYTFPPTARNPLGEFDASKIGTGEGAQAYGYGIYTAEAPATAMEYQRKLSSTGSAKNLANQYGGVDEGLAEAKRRVESYKQLIADGGGGAMSRAKSMLKISEKNVQDLEAVKAGLPENTGNLYKADLPDAMIPKMLDYDKPLSKQPEIMKALTPEAMGLKLRVAPEGGFMAYVSPDGVPIGLQVKGATPENFRKKWLDRIAEFGDAEGGAGRVIGYLGGNSPTSAAQVSEALRQAGIPGIKYLDEGSRNLANTWIVKNPKGGENVFSSKESAEAFLKRNPGDTLISPKVTRNFVTFPGEEKNLRILERNAEVASPMYTDPFGNTIADTTR